MDRKIKMKSLIKKTFTSQMVENNYHHFGYIYWVARITTAIRNDAIFDVINKSVDFSDAPQGFGYWARIRDNETW